ncbi:MAG: hypothetical protein D6760_03645 [Deltaproteobacteria bacterium]|nr:MAG: hypothetical protein D6760_03645 [Deltaproteobacteria bacterium]
MCWSGACTPAPAETCDGADNDCDGTVDEGGNALCDDHNPCTADTCNGSGGCAHLDAQNLSCCGAGQVCWSGACTPAPAETCDGADNDCDGTIDEGGNALCDDHDSCTIDTCNGTGGCSHVFDPICQ